MANMTYLFYLRSEWVLLLEIKPFERIVCCLQTASERARVVTLWQLNALGLCLILPKVVDFLRLINAPRSKQRVSPICRSISFELRPISLSKHVSACYDHFKASIDAHIPFLGSIITFGYVVESLTMSSEEKQLVIDVRRSCSF